jgi:hypothetical protein
VNGDYWREIGRAAEEFSNLDPSTLAQMIKEEENTIAEAERAKEAHRQHGNIQWHQELRKARRAIARQAALQRRLAVDFGATRGLTLSRSTFGLRTLAQGKQHDGGQRFMLDGRRRNPDTGLFHTQFDHPYFYRRDRKAAAIAAHLYGMPNCREQCLALAADFSLSFEIPDFPSWWNPGGTTLVLYLGPAANCLQEDYIANH